MINRISVSILFLFILMTTACQEGSDSDTSESERRKSPIAIAKVNHNDTYLKVVYGQPYMKGREIFGDLVPYNQVWRTGANEATELTATSDILFAGNRLEAGTYALFTIPGQEQWTIILNSELGQWGAFEYDSNFDVVRTDVNATTTENATEAFSIQFGEVANDTTSMIMRWENTSVRVPIRFDVSAQATS